MSAWRMRWSPAIVETRTEWGVQWSPSRVALADEEVSWQRSEQDARDVVRYVDPDATLVSRVVQVGAWEPVTS